MTLKIAKEDIRKLEKRLENIEMLSFYRRYPDVGEMIGNIEKQNEYLFNELLEGIKKDLINFKQSKSEKIQKQIDRIEFVIDKYIQIK